MMLRRAVLTAIAAVAVAAAALPASASAGMRFGFNDDADHVVRAGNLLDRSQAQIMRVPIYWPEIEPQPGIWDFTKPDGVYARLTERGIRPLFVVFGVPGHASLDVDTGLGGLGRGAAEPDDGSWRRLWSTVAARYPRAILQVFNEPNAAVYGARSPQRVAELVNSAAASAQTARPGARVLGPPAAPNGDWRPYVRALYDRTAAGVEVAVNIYPRVPPTWRSDFRKDLRFARKIAHGRKLWITETGLSRMQYGRRRQARGSAWIYRRARRARVRSVIFHRLIPRRDTTAWDIGLAATDFKLRPLPLFKALREVVRAQ
jgi:hypothetical protein